MRADPSPRAESSVTVCYNGACPVCRHGMERYRRIARPLGLPLGWHDINTAPELFRRFEIDFDTAMRRLHAVDEQGRLLRGVDVFIAIWRALPGYRRLAAVAGFPLVRPFAWFVYEVLVSYPVYPLSRHRWRRRRARNAAR
jgi:predicted DCC family thiol-disulfide oxidoreductase YuxK